MIKCRRYPRYGFNIATLYGRMLRMNLPDVKLDPQSDEIVFVDFDHTLLAANSTELFIVSCKPAAVASVFEVLIRRCVPWSRLGIANPHRVRDYLCVMSLAILMPWNVLLWRRNAPAVFERLASSDLSTTLRSVRMSRITIISFGMKFIIRALLAKSALANVKVIATPALSPPSYFSQGKRSLAVAAVGDAATRASTLITDSREDEDLLAYCRDGILISQQGATTCASKLLFFPLRYFARVKYNRAYLVDQILLVDLAISVLSLASSLSSFFCFLLICPFFVISLNCIYEIGYFENDMHAAATEAKPVLSDKVAEYRDYPVAVDSWVWAIGLAAAGLFVAMSTNTITAALLLPSLALWVAALVAIRATFYLYNRINTQRRVAVYPILQMLKYGSIFLLFSPHTLGVVLVVSQIATLWTNYIIYRHGGQNGPFQKNLFRLQFFAISASLFTLGIIIDDREPPLMLATSSYVFCLVVIMAWLGFRLIKTEKMGRLLRFA